MYVLRDLRFEELVKLMEEAIGVKVLESEMTPEGYKLRFERDLTSEEAVRLATITGKVVFKEASPQKLMATPIPIKTFEDKARRKLEEMREGGEITAYCLDSVDEATKTAIALTYTQTTEGVKEERVLITEKEGKISMEKIL